MPWAARLRGAEGNDVGPCRSDASQFKLGGEEERLKRRARSERRACPRRRLGRVLRVVVRVVGVVERGFAAAECVVDRRRVGVSAGTERRVEV